MTSTTPFSRFKSDPETILESQASRAAFLDEMEEMGRPTEFLRTLPNYYELTEPVMEFLLVRTGLIGLTGPHLDVANWRWTGHSGHFLMSDSCRFRLTTVVGRYLISSVGELLGPNGQRELIHGYGPNNRPADDRDYETMVFRIVRLGRAGELVRSQVDLNELETVINFAPLDAEQTHVIMCHKYSFLTMKNPTTFDFLSGREVQGTPPRTDA